MSSSRAARVGLLQICLAAVLWGTGGISLRLIRECAPMSVLTISAYRMVLAAMLLLLVLGSRRRLGELRLTRRTAFVGATTGAYQALYFAAVVEVGVTVATVVSLGIAPLLLTIGESVHAKTRPSRKQVVILASALTGLLMVSTHARYGVTGPRPTVGVLLAVASGMGWAAATVAGRSLSMTTSSLALTTAATAVGGAVLAPFALAAGVAGSPLISANPVVITLIIYLAAATMALAYGLLYAGLRVTRSSTATVASLLEPATAALAAAIVLGERVGLVGAVGTILILAAVIGLSR